MKFTAEVTDKTTSINFSDGTLKDILKAVAMIVRAVDKSEDLDIEDRMFFRMFVRDLLPDIAFGNSEEIDFVSFLLEKLLGENKE